MARVLIRDGGEKTETHRGEVHVKMEAQTAGYIQPQGSQTATTSWKRQGTEEAFRESAVLPTPLER